VSDRVIVCRCEDLTLQDIRAVIAAGATTIEEIKRLTRCGMGPCQGRTCRQVVAGEIARATGVPLEQVALPTFRPPVQAVKLSTILRGDAGAAEAGVRADAGAAEAGMPGDDPSSGDGPRA
jgi:bacterioferritin-associated ferredoxin